MLKPLTLLFLCLILCGLATACGVDESERTEPLDDRTVLFEHVWNQVNERFHDPAFNGLDWSARYLHYRPLAARAASEAELLDLLNLMLRELNSSHCGVDTLAGIRSRVSPYVFAEGSVGLDVRIIEDAIVIKEVREGSSADLAGLKPGFVIDRIEGRSLDDFKSMVTVRPPCNERNRRFHLTSEVLRALYGPADMAVSIRCLDGDDNPMTVNLQREARTDPVTLTPAIPPLFLETESRMLDERIAYLRFNAFQPPGLEPVLEQLDELISAAGLVIDLRGNDGGSIEAMKHLLGRFVREPELFGTYVSRHEHTPDTIVPEGRRFEGRIAVLVDEMSISGAENMPGIMQLLDLAVVVGEQTPGQMLCGDFTVFGERFGLVLPTARLVYTDGRNLEGEGVIPDRSVPLDRASLLRGVDPQLQAAVACLSE